MATRKGFKPGFVAHQYRRTFGTYPKFSPEQLSFVKPARFPFIPYHRRPTKRDEEGRLDA
ncbi:hypothetical protein D3C83_213120 [compost metagenome]